MTTLLRNHRNDKQNEGSAGMTPTASATPGLSVHHAPQGGDARVRIIGTLVLVAGLLLGMSGVGTWALVQENLADERITVAEDAARFGGEPIDGPLTAYYEAQVIQKHSLTAGAGRTYAEIDRTDPVRATVATGAFLRASLFTSVVSFGIAAMAMGLGLVFMLIGFALRSIGRTTPART